MTLTDYLALGPLIAMALTAVLVMLQIAVRRCYTAAAVICVAGLAASFFCLGPAVVFSTGRATAMMAADSYAFFYTGLILLATMATALLGYGYLKKADGQNEEFFLLLPLAALGAAVIVGSRHFAAFFIGLEILSIALYALIAYPRHRSQSVEAGLKYLVLAAAAAAFLLFGMALIYMATGTMDLVRLAAWLSSPPATAGRSILLAGTAMLVVAIGFKLALVPFHMWTPDVYQGAPAPVTGFVATVSKAAIAALLVRLFARVDLLANRPLFWIFASIAAASMVAGNLLALRQNQVKRILAYSSIAHMGYLLVAFMAGGRMGAHAVAFYLVAYTITNIGAFGIIAVLSPADGDADNLEVFKGLFFRHPWLAGLFTATLFSLAGIPLTAGFVAKFYLVTAGVHSALWGLVIALLVTSGISLFYYLRVVVALFTQSEQEPAEAALQPAVGFSGALVLATVAILMLWLGLAPGPVLLLIRGIAG
jgi:NADH-quinone oxidoreductase subunit N